MYIRTYSHKNQIGGTITNFNPITAPITSPTPEDLYGPQVNQMTVMNSIRNWNERYQELVAENDDRTAHLRQLLRKFKSIYPNYWATNADTDTDFNTTSPLSISPYRERNVEEFDDRLSEI